VIGVDLERSKRNFFDRAAVLARTTPAERRVLSKFGTFVRTRARSSIGKPTKRISRRGEPPNSHTKDKFVSLRNILFAFDPIRRSVVIGPVKLNQKQYLGGKLQSGTVPEVLEYGGTAGIREKQRYPGGKWTSMGRRRPRPGEAVRVRLAKYEARPFMRPAFLKEQSESLPKIWRNAV